MSKKTFKKPIKSESPKPVARPEDTAYLVREDLEDQPKPLTKAAAPPTAPSIEPDPVVPSAKPLAPLAALWPDSTPSEPQPKPPQTPAPSTANPPAPPAATAKTAAATPALKPVQINFALLKPKAQRVSVCGEFNGWSPTATPLTRGNDGQWRTSLPLAPGRYQYKFLVDGEWLLDPSAQVTERNSYGSLNSVVEVRP